MTSPLASERECVVPALDRVVHRQRVARVGVVQADAVAGLVRADGLVVVGAGRADVRERDGVVVALVGLDDRAGAVGEDERAGQRARAADARHVAAVDDRRAVGVGVDRLGRRAEVPRAEVRHVGHAAGVVRPVPVRVRDDQRRDRLVVPVEAAAVDVVAVVARRPGAEPERVLRVRAGVAGDRGARAEPRRRRGPVAPCGWLAGSGRLDGAAVGGVGDGHGRRAGSSRGARRARRGSRRPSCARSDRRRAPHVTPGSSRSSVTSVTPPSGSRIGDTVSLTSQAPVAAAARDAVRAARKVLGDLGRAVGAGSCVTVADERRPGRSAARRGGRRGAAPPASSSAQAASAANAGAGAIGGRAAADGETGGRRAWRLLRARRVAPSPIASPRARRERSGPRTAQPSSARRMNGPSVAANACVRCDSSWRTSTPPMTAKQRVASQNWRVRSMTLHVRRAQRARRRDERVGPHRGRARPRARGLRAGGRRRSRATTQRSCSFVDGGVSRMTTTRRRMRSRVADRRRGSRPGRCRCGAAPAVRLHARAGVRREEHRVDLGMLGAARRSTWLFHVAALLRARGVARIGVARVAGQPERRIETPRQRLASVSTVSAVLRFAAWLSPMSANVRSASSATAPKPQAVSSPCAGPCRSTGRRRSWRARAAAATLLRRSGFSHGFAESRAAAPKQGATASSTTLGRRPRRRRARGRGTSPGRSPSSVQALSAYQA